MNTIKAININKHYGSVYALKNVNLEVRHGEIISIVGASGAGKSTLLHILGTLDKSETGALYINEKDVFRFSEKELAKFRNEEIGFVYQFHHLLPEFTALENVCMPALIGGRSKTDSIAEAMQLLSFLQVEHRAEHKPSEMSGGEQQRIAVARALINSPSVLLADEPSGNLDSAAARELHELFFKLRDAYRQTFVIVTHNEELADMADRKIVMKDGEIIQQ